jgi:hypothetical protein
VIETVCLTTEARLASLCLRSPGDDGQISSKERSYIKQDIRIHLPANDGPRLPSRFPAHLLSACTRGTRDHQADFRKSTATEVPGAP